MYHSITIGNKNTWNDWHLIPTSRPLVSLPSVNTKMVEIPGRNGSIDLSEYLTGSRTYSRRKGSWEFYVIQDKWNASWAEVYATIAAYVHGKQLDIVLEDDPNYKYSGLLTLSWRSSKDYSTITIEYDLEPQKVNTVNGAVIIP